jgi:hypothetical protein
MHSRDSGRTCRRQGLPSLIQDIGPADIVNSILPAFVEFLNLGPAAGAPTLAMNRSNPLFRHTSGRFP